MFNLTAQDLEKYSTTGDIQRLPLRNRQEELLIRGERGGERW